MASLLILTGTLIHQKIQDSKKNKREKKERDLLRFQALEKENAERMAKLEHKSSTTEKDELVRSRSLSRERQASADPPDHEEAMKKAEGSSRVVT